MQVHDLVRLDYVSKPSINIMLFFSDIRFDIRMLLPEDNYKMGGIKFGYDGPVTYWETQNLFESRLCRLI